MNLYKHKDFPDLAYCSDTGDFTWLTKRKGVRFVGQVAGTKLKSGYLQIRYDGNFYLAHRLAFLFVTGEFPHKNVDHINGVPHDNRFFNLRDVSQSQNLKNMKRYKTNKSGTSGVHFCKSDKVWLAYVFDKGKQYNLGRFKCFTAALIARKRAEPDFGYHSNHGRVL